MNENNIKSEKDNIDNYIYMCIYIYMCVCVLNAYGILNPSKMINWWFVFPIT